VFAAPSLPFLASHAVLVAAQDQGVGKVLTLIALPVANDTGGWLAGITFGRHPMAPSVSPKKSWEGFAGSMIAAVCAGALCLWALGGPWWTGAVLGATIVVVSTLGDLGESLLKRDLGLKDMGTLLPGRSEEPPPALDLLRRQVGRKVHEVVGIALLTSVDWSRTRRVLRRGVLGITVRHLLRSHPRPPSSHLSPTAHSCRPGPQA